MSTFSNPSQLPYYCVVGKPISHSLSPVIHQSFAANLGIALNYERIEVAPNTLSQAVKGVSQVRNEGLGKIISICDVTSLLGNFCFLFKRMKGVFTKLPVA